MDGDEQNGDDDSAATAQLTAFHGLRERLLMKHAASVDTACRHLRALVGELEQVVLSLDSSSMALEQSSRGSAATDSSRLASLILACRLLHREFTQFANAIERLRPGTSASDDSALSPAAVLDQWQRQQWRQQIAGQ